MISDDEIRRAAALIRAGELVAFPTETVYGLGANALDPAAVQRIFERKGRPSTSPLIVHVDSVAMAQSLVREWPEPAGALARQFWPGPLTLVLPKAAHVPDIVTAGLATVGIRIPANPIALALLRESGLPIAAPSANRFTELSPTTAEHVREAFGDALTILDGGPTDVGIESTVLSLEGGAAVLLRPGMISRTQIESVIGAIRLGTDPATGPHASPGQHARHYRPRHPLMIVKPGQLPLTGRGAYLWISDDAEGAAISVEMPAGAPAYAAKLYAALHEIDSENLDWIAVEEPPDGPEWEGIRDRLRRASSSTPPS